MRFQQFLPASPEHAEEDEAEANDERAGDDQRPCRACAEEAYECDGLQNVDEMREDLNCHI